MQQPLPEKSIDHIRDRPWDQQQCSKDPSSWIILIQKQGEEEGDYGDDCHGTHRKDKTGCQRIPEFIICQNFLVIPKTRKRSLGSFKVIAMKTEIDGVSQWNQDGHRKD